MLNIKILCIGKIKEKSLKELNDEYVKRLSKYCKLEIIELEDEKIPVNVSLKTENIIKQKESLKILDKLAKYEKSNVYLLDLTGKEYNSVEFSNIIEKATNVSSSLVFVIGGSLGMSEELLNYTKNKLCFSKLTFPHQLIRIFLLEQIFRGFKILNNETYHH